MTAARLVRPPDAAGGRSTVIRDFPMPPSLSDRAEASVQGLPLAPVPARASASVLLVRDSAGAGVDLFLLCRQPTTAFAPGMHVFPGGGVDSRDSDDVPWAGPAAEQWGAWLGCDCAVARELVCAAVRETFEECGVLLAGPDARTVVDEVTGDDWEADRRSLVSHEVALSELLGRRGLVLRSDLLRPWSHWVTPEFESHRYDTRFFLAVLPQGQKARHVEGGEASESGWWRASEVLAGDADGRFRLMPPTLVGVEEVAAARTTEDLLGAARTVSAVLPWLVVHGDGSERSVWLRAELPG